MTILRRASATALALIVSGALALSHGTPAAAAEGDCWGAAVATLNNGSQVKVCAVNQQTGPSANAFHDCWGNYLCFWRDVEFQGPLWMYANYSDGRCITFTSTNNNSISSWRSRLTSPSNEVYMFRPSACSGGIPNSDWTLKPDKYDNAMGGGPFGSEDQWSSVDYG